VAAKMDRLCFNVYGCRVVLKLFDILAIVDENQLVGFAENYIEANLKRMIVDQSANYIVQKLVYLLSRYQVKYIVDFFMKDVRPFLSEFGLVVQPLRLQGLAEGHRQARNSKGTLHSKKKDAIFDQIKGRFYDLSFCQFGNYLMQHLAEKGSEKYRTILYEIIVNNIHEMSFDKYAR
jgi:pumilio RNA-binding family